MRVPLPLHCIAPMVFNLPTLLAITAFTSGLGGCLLLLSWLQHRKIFALALWGSAFTIAAIATVLIVIARGTVPDFWSIVIGNAIHAVAYGLIWSGARSFEGKRVSIVLTLAGARRRRMALADHVAAARARSRRSGPYSACRLAGRSLSHSSGIADLCSFRDIVPLHLRGIFIRKSREGSNCRPPSERC